MEVLVVDGNIILKLDLKEIVREDVDWINLARDRIQERAFLNAVMNHGVPLNGLLDGLTYSQLLMEEILFFFNF